MATERDYDRLRRSLAELKRLFLIADEALEEPASVGSLERASISLRKMVEGIALFSLVVNRDLLEVGEATVQTAAPKQVHSRLRKLNPGYWPIPQSISREGNDVTILGVHDGFLRSTDYGRAIGRTSAWIHAPNPYKSPLDVAEGHRDLRWVLDRAEILLRAFTMTLPDDTQLLLCSCNLGRRGARDLSTEPTVGELSKVGDLT